MYTLVEMEFGSHLYGTAGPQSDHDYKGVFMPSREDVLLGRIPKAMSFKRKKAPGEKNTPDDVDRELYSLHYFLKLACDSETVAIDMLHAPASAWKGTPDSLWLYLAAHRADFYSKNMKALVGYARRQAAKYGIKGSRLEEAERVLTFLKEEAVKSPGIHLEDLWDSFPKGEHIHQEPRTYPETVVIVDVCGKHLQSSARVESYIPTLERFVENYGARAKQARDNAGIDWKAVSHAFRAAYQMKHILQDGDFTYPLPETSFIRLVKEGKLDFTTEVGPALDSLMDVVEALSENSSLPAQPDRVKWERWLYDVMDTEMEIS